MPDVDSGGDGTWLVVANRRLESNEGETMNHEAKIAWMNEWAANHGATVTLEGECGFGRECVGILAAGVYPEYETHDDDWNRIDDNGDVWRPASAYHKHPCVAVLGRGEDAEAQLYEWLRWFDANGFVVETGTIPRTPKNALQLLFTGDKWARMVKCAKAAGVDL